MSKLSIRQWAEEDRPREKLLMKGASALSDAELLAILVNSGSTKESAVQLSQRMLHAVGHNLNTFGKLTVKELTNSFNGIGKARAAVIIAAFELGKRRNAAETMLRATIRTSRDSYLLFHPLLADLPHEELWILLTNNAAKVIEKIKISQGGTNETTADLRLILKAAINALATGIVICHNHPSGSVTPSRADDNLTNRLQSAAKLMDIILLDHIVLADGCYYSYADEGRLNG